MEQIADRLCCSFGQDLQDSLFSRQTLGRRVDGTHPHIRPLALVGLNVAYVGTSPLPHTRPARAPNLTAKRGPAVAHTLVLFYQLVTLNVAINSYSNALLTLLLSNQFVEIKGSVFKKFEKENLFQMTCAGPSRLVVAAPHSALTWVCVCQTLWSASSSPSCSLSSRCGT